MHDSGFILRGLRGEDLDVVMLVRHILCCEAWAEIMLGCRFI
jgi:hypothetical protein